MVPCVFFFSIHVQLSVIIKILGLFKTTSSHIVPPTFWINSKKELGHEDYKERSLLRGGRWQMPHLWSIFSESDLGQCTGSHFWMRPRKCLLPFSSGEKCAKMIWELLFSACICLGKSKKAVGLNYKIHLETTTLSWLFGLAWVINLSLNQAPLSIGCEGTKDE